MTVVTPVQIPLHNIQLEPGSVLSISDVDWATFESILQEQQNYRPRIAYYQGILEIVAPLPEHELAKDLTSDIVKLLLKATGRRYQPFASTTFKRDGIAGVEPDACFYIQNYQRMIGRRRLQPDDPPPDLAIETDLTSKTTLAAYQAIGVLELWIHTNQQLKIYVLEHGGYVLTSGGPTFPDLPISDWVSTTVERSWQVGSYQALEEFELAFCFAVPEGIATYLQNQLK
jgi:Uma2 family endonuclease